MANDPAFLFYPGDYLRDTQTLGENSQVAYDRIMCEHMRNICISKRQLKFFTKRLSEEEIDELMFVLTEVEGGYQISWVAESIEKRRKYSESRRKNRSKKKDNICKSHDEHMENEIEIDNESENENEYKGGYGGKPNPTVEEMRNYLSQYEIELTDKDAEEFLNYYQARDWIVKGTPIVKWQPALKKWMNNEFRNIKIPKGNRLNGRKNRAPEPEPGQDFGEL